MPQQDRVLLFDRIMIANSAPIERNTGKELHDDCIKFFSGKGGILKVEIREIETKEDFLDLLDELTYNAKSQNEYPILHIEAHGSVALLEFRNGDVCTWEEMRSFIQKLNVSTKGNLLITVAACSGLHMIKIASILEPCPFHTIIGPDKSIGESHLVESFVEFYRTLLFHDDILQGVREMNNVSARRKSEIKFRFVNAELLFFGAFKEYLKTTKKIARVDTTENRNDYNRFRAKFLMQNDPNVGSTMSWETFKVWIKAGR